MPIKWPSARLLRRWFVFFFRQHAHFFTVQILVFSFTRQVLFPPSKEVSPCDFPPSPSFLWPLPACKPVAALHQAASSAETLPLWVVLPSPLNVKTQVADFRNARQHSILPTVSMPSMAKSHAAQEGKSAWRKKKENIYSWGRRDIFC